MAQTREKIYKCVEQKIKTILNIEEQIDGDRDLISIGMNSLTTIQLLVELELEFSMSVPDEEMLLDHFQTIDHIVEVVFKYSGNKSVNDKNG